MKSIQVCFFSGVVILLLAGCAPAASQPTAQPQATETEIPSTITLTPSASVTTVPSLTLTLIPAATRRATFTSEVLTPTITPLASFTLKPGSKFTRTATPTITRTRTLYVRPPLWYGSPFTTTPVPFKCTIESSYPADYQVFKPRTDFVAKWKVRNSGENMWHKDDILFGFVSGTKMHNDSRDDKILDYTLFVNDHMDVQIHMKPPKAPGIYTETWGLRKTNKKEFFCLLTVIIEVRK